MTKEEVIFWVHLPYDFLVKNSVFVPYIFKILLKISVSCHLVQTNIVFPTPNMWM